MIQKLYKWLNKLTMKKEKTKKAIPHCCKENRMHDTRYSILKLFYKRKEIIS